MKTGLYLSLFILVSVFYSCEKDDDSSPVGAPSRYSRLTAHYWKKGNYSAVEYRDTNGDSVIDTSYYSGGVDSCSSDDRIYFLTNGIRIRDFGSIHCNAPNDTLTWDLVNNDTQLLIDSNGYTDIVALSESQLALRDTYLLFIPDLVTVVLTQTYIYP